MKTEPNDLPHQIKKRIIGLRKIMVTLSAKKNNPILLNVCKLINSSEGINRLSKNEYF